MDWFCHLCSVHSMLTWQGAGRLWEKVIVVPALTLTYSLLWDPSHLGERGVSFWVPDARRTDHTLAGPVCDHEAWLRSESGPSHSTDRGTVGSALRWGNRSVRNRLRRWVTTRAEVSVRLCWHHFPKFNRLYSRRNAEGPSNNSRGVLAVSAPPPRRCILTQDKTCPEQHMKNWPISPVHSVRIITAHTGRGFEIAGPVLLNVVAAVNTVAASLMWLFTF